MSQASETRIAHDRQEREAVVAAVAAALRQQSRQSVHPCDQAALWHAATRIARVLESEFRLTLRKHGCPNPRDSG